MKPNPLHFKADILLEFVSDEYLTRIGRIITQWSMMEVFLDSSIWQAGRMRTDLGRTVTSQMQVLGKLDLLGSLLTQTRPALAVQFRPVADYIRDCLNGKRNLVAHGLWARPDEEHESPTIVIKYSARGRLVKQGRPIEADELDALARDIADVTVWLYDLGLLLPAPKLPPEARVRQIPDIQSRQDCATLKQRALQPPTLRRKAPSRNRARKPRQS